MAKVKMEEDKPSDFSFNNFSIIEKEVNGMEYAVAYPDKKGKETKEGLEGWESHDKANRELIFVNDEKEAKRTIKSFGMFENKMSLKSIVKNIVVKENIDDDHYVTGSDSKYVELLKAVENDWGKDSDLYSELEDAIVVGSYNSIKKVLANYDVEEDYLSMIEESTIKESRKPDLNLLKKNTKAFEAARAIIVYNTLPSEIDYRKNYEIKANKGQDYLDSLSPDESKPYFDYIEYELDNQPPDYGPPTGMHSGSKRDKQLSQLGEASPAVTQNKLMTDIRVNVEKILRFLVAAAKHNKKDKALHTELTRFNSIKGLLDKSDFEAVVSGFTFESKK